MGDWVITLERQFRLEGAAGGQQAVVAVLEAAGTLDLALHVVAKLTEIGDAGMDGVAAGGAGQVRHGHPLARPLGEQSEDQVVLRGGLVGAGEDVHGRVRMRWLVV